MDHFCHDSSTSCVAPRPCDPAGCDYEQKGALCSMALPRLEAGSDPSMIISVHLRSGHCQSLPPLSASARFPTQPCQPMALPIARPGAFALADSVSVCPASQIVRFDIAKKTRSAAPTAAAKRGSETRRRQARTKLHAPRSALSTHASRLTPHAHMQPLW